MTNPSQATPSHEHAQFLLLLQVTGVHSDTIDRLAKEIHDAYMEEWRAIGAFTRFLFRLDLVKPGTNSETQTWSFALGYFGPVASVGWLQQRLERDFQHANGTVTTQTYRMNDITGRY
jgi:hypothetical protein